MLPPSYAKLSVSTLFSVSTIYGLGVAISTGAVVGDGVAADAVVPEEPPKVSASGKE